jgi:hypothetical protein
MTDTELAEWIADHRTNLPPQLLRAAVEGYPVAGGYIDALVQRVLKLDLQLTPVPESLSMPLDLFDAEHAVELRPNPSLYAFTVHDRIAAAVVALQLAGLAPGTQFKVSPVYRITEKRAVSRMHPYTGVVVEISHPAAPEPACVIFEAEQPQ